MSDEELPDSDPRVQAYADALRAVGPWKPENLARAVIKVADSETAELREKAKAVVEAWAFSVGYDPCPECFKSGPTLLDGDSEAALDDAVDALQESLSHEHANS